jgi:hypothetical protein
VTTGPAHNAMLSRAKWRVVIEGSLGFYRHFVKFLKAFPLLSSDFLKRFLRHLIKLRSQMLAAFFAEAASYRPIFATN